ncbi:MAG: hypothetical protein QOG64_1245 [Acidimicrobiaceae bacterium]|nr:hypothetical protein [Acidimicrobiaceae bacterium]
MVSGAVVLASGLLMSCGVPDSASEARRLVFSEQEFKIGVNNKSVAAGHIPVRSENHGAIAHELVAFRTDLSEADLPLVDDGTKVDEEGAGITHLDPEAENILPDTAKDITIVLRPGRYVFLCNLPTHYKSGMHAVVDVH